MHLCQRGLIHDDKDGIINDCIQWRCCWSRGWAGSRCLHIQLNSIQAKSDQLHGSSLCRQARDRYIATAEITSSGVKSECYLQISH